MSQLSHADLYFLEIFTSKTVKEIKFSDRDSIKKLFCFLHHYLSKNDLRNFEKLLNDSLDKLIAENRLKQFLNFWKIYLSFYESRIDRSLISKIDREIYFLENLRTDKKELTDQMINVALRLAPEISVYTRLYQEIFDSYLRRCCKRLAMVKLYPGPLVVKNALICAYSLIIHNNDNDDIYELMNLLSFHGRLKNTYKLSCHKLSLDPIQFNKIDQSEIKKVKLGIVEKENLPKFDNSTVAEEANKGRQIEKILGEDEANLHYILNKEFSFVLGSLSQKIGSESYSTTSLIFLIETLFAFNELRIAKKIFNTLALKKSRLSEKFILSVLLKKLLARNKEKKQFRTFSRKPIE